MLEIFQWLTPQESANLDPEQRLNTEEEIADVLVYLLRLADVLDVDLNEAVWNKLASNETRYAVNESKGSHAKRR